ncbi:MAG: hypothetical protein KatS3mg131_3778 [Candidatus Tectimicrobiota bacterium]|nr:MAG: hypothetical protein KatS3mg131_3778 [Candidatus Tectomicrobia bacterium]
MKKFVYEISAIFIFYTIISPAFYVSIREYDYGKPLSRNLKNFGMDIRQNTEETDSILMPIDYSWQLKFYADRVGYGEVKDIETAHRLASQRGRGTPYYFVPFGLAFEDRGALEALLAHYPSTVLPHSLRFALGRREGEGRVARRQHRVWLQDGRTVRVEAWQGHGVPAQVLCWQAEAVAASPDPVLVRLVRPGGQALPEAYPLHGRDAPARRCVALPAAADAVALRFVGPERVAAAARHVHRLLRYGTFGLLGQEPAREVVLGTVFFAESEVRRPAFPAQRHAGS